MDPSTKVIGLFPTLIYKTTFPREFNKKEKNSYNKVLNDTYPNIHNIISTEQYALNNEKGLSEIKKFIEVHLNQYTCNIYNFSRKNEIFITSSWINLTKPKMSHHIHSHPNSFISGVFYFETLEKDNICFLGSGPRQSHLVPSIGINNKIGDIHKEWVKDGTLLLFPSGLNHYVEENKEEKNRISLAFNTYVKGQFGEGISSVKI